MFARRGKNGFWVEGTRCLQNPGQYIMQIKSLGCYLQSNPSPAIIYLVTFPSSEFFIWKAEIILVSPSHGGQD